MKPTNVKLLGTFLFFSCASSLSISSLTVSPNIYPLQSLARQLISDASLNNKIPAIAEVTQMSVLEGGTLTHGEILMLFLFLFFLNAHKRGGKNENKQVKFEEETFERLLN